MRHPFLEGGAGQAFVPNSFSIGSECGSATSSSCLLLTGPNMGGKSTTLRLACFASLLAQVMTSRSCAEQVTCLVLKKGASG